MHRGHSTLFQRDVVTIFPGEVYVTKTQEAISTVLGSCISVCLVDPVAKVAGMNHFMLPVMGPNAVVPTVMDPSVFYHDSYRYGSVSMEVLIGEMQKAGAARSRFHAKVFGGGNVLRAERSVIDIGEKNIRFAMAYLEAEKIEVLTRDVGGHFGRRIYFFPEEDRVLRKEIRDDEVAQVAQREDAYGTSLGKRPTSGGVDLF